MIALSIAAIFAALLILVLLALPGRRVSKARLGIERQPVSVGRSMNDFLERRGKRAGLAQALALADVTIDPGQFALRVLVASLLLSIVGLVINPLLALVGLFLPYLVVRSWVSSKGRKRQQKFAEQLPDAIQILIVSLRSGMGLTAALEVLTHDVDEPVRSEIAQVLSEVRVGRDLIDALRSLSQRMDNPDMDWVIGAIDINRETGGNLSEILENVNETIRGRQRIKRKIRTFTAEGRLSAKVMVALPAALFLWEWRTNDNFDNFGTSLGLMALFAAVALMVLGTVWIRSMSNIKY